MMTVKTHVLKAFQHCRLPPSDRQDSANLAQSTHPHHNWGALFSSPSASSKLTTESEAISADSSYGSTQYK